LCTLIQGYIQKIFDAIWAVDWEHASARALEEEAKICTSAKTRQIYVSKCAALIINVRKSASEAASASKKASVGGNMVVSHLDIIAGKGGARGSWSIEKKLAKSLDIEAMLKGMALHELLSKYVLTDEQLREHNFPVRDVLRPDRARFPNLEKEPKYKVPKYESHTDKSLNSKFSPIISKKYSVLISKIFGIVCLLNTNGSV
jgi:hypothetical protein